MRKISIPVCRCCSGRTSNNRNFRGCCGRALRCCNCAVRCSAAAADTPPAAATSAAAVTKENRNREGEECDENKNKKKRMNHEKNIPVCRSLSSAPGPCRSLLHRTHLTRTQIRGRAVRCFSGTTACGSNFRCYSGRISRGRNFHGCRFRGKLKWRRRIID